MAKLQWNVTAQAFSRWSGQPSGPARTECVESNNVLFSRCHTIMEVKAAYEGFWNDLNPSSNDVVFVQKILPVR